MIGIAFKEAKKAFFDYRKIQNRVDKAVFRNLTIFGGYTRKTARNSMKYVGKRAMAKVSDLLVKLSSKAAQVNRAYRAKLKAQLLAAQRAVSSKPGQPPKAILGLLKKLMLFAIDKQKRSVVIGPTLSNSPSGAPDTLEHGGYATIGNRRIKIAKRPFMAPAFKKAEKAMASKWKNSVKP